jgi:hypothetical protein
VAFPNADLLHASEVLGRLKVTSTLGDRDADGDYDQLHAFGGRSFSIFQAGKGRLRRVFDSGSLLEEITAAFSHQGFNAENDENGSFDKRSDNKGPEPQGVAVGSIDGRTHAFIGLERTGGIVVFDVSNPGSPEFVQVINNRSLSGDPVQGTAGALGPGGAGLHSGLRQPHRRASAGCGQRSERHHNDLRYQQSQSLGIRHSNPPVPSLPGGKGG